jgi:hypothetical protein
VKRKKKADEPEVVGFLGVGLDGKDEHTRLTRSEHFVLLGGSDETHERLQDTAIRFEEELQKKGKTLEETSTEEALDILRKAIEDGK